MPDGARPYPDVSAMIPAPCRFPFPDARTIPVLLALAGPAAVHAQTSLYETEVAWSAGDAAGREAAFRRALRQVLVKVTGLRRLAGAAEFEPLVESAQGLVQQYQMRTVAVGSGEAAVQEPRLWARFDEAAVDRLVREAELPAWRRPRSEVLAWVAVENGGARRMVGAEDTEGIAEIFRHGAASRGVPLVLPLLDLEDQARVGPSDLWAGPWDLRAGAEDRFRAASERYRPGATLIGRIDRPNGVLWEARWSLLFPGAAQRWKTEGDVLGLVVDEGVQEVIDALFAHYASAAPVAPRAAIEVSVSGVRDFAGYARTMRYLESLDEIESIEVLSVTPERLRLGLELRTGATGLREALALGSTLAEDTGGAEGAGGVLALRLLP